MKKTLKRRKNRNYGSLVVIVIVILDQLTKYFAKSVNIDLINNFLSITYITNTGSLFGILKGTNYYLVFFSLIVLGLIMFYWDKIKENEKVFFALITGGIIGNLLDRIIYGKVTDFIYFHFWPAFNVADSCLTIGIIGLIIYSLFKNQDIK